MKHDRALFLVMAVAASCLGVVGSATVNANNRTGIPQHRADDVWRDPPIPHYIVAMSADDELCDKVAKALNEPTTPKGAPARSLYRDPMFLKWQKNPTNLKPKSAVEDVEFAFADLFNEGYPSLFGRLKIFQTSYYVYALCKYPGQDWALISKWKNLEDVGRKTDCQRRSDLYQVKSSGGFALETFTARDLNRLSLKMAQERWDLRNPGINASRTEFNVIVSERRNVMVLRNIKNEVFLLTEFDGAAGKNICLIGPEAPVFSL